VVLWAASSARRQRRQDLSVPFGQTGGVPSPQVKRCRADRLSPSWIKSLGVDHLSGTGSLLRNCACLTVNDVDKPCEGERHHLTGEVGNGVMATAPASYPIRRVVWARLAVALCVLLAKHVRSISKCVSLVK
jgi:hypothetical protein